TTERTDEALPQVREFYQQLPEVRDVLIIRGFSFFGQGQANAMAFIVLHPWEERTDAASRADALALRAMGALNGIKQAMVFALNPPPIPELGVASGFTFKLQDRAGRGRDALLQARNELLGMATQSPILAGVRPEDQEEAPQLRV